MMELLLKIAAGAVAAAVCAGILRRNSPEFAIPILLAAGMWILWMTVQAMGEVVASIVRLTQVAQLETELVEPVVKVVGLSLITRITGEVCRAAGEGGVAAFVDVAGTILALAAALPLVNAVVEMIGGMLG